MRRSRVLAVALTLASLLALPAVHAQQAGKIAKVGWIAWAPAGPASARAKALESFRSGMRDRGWEEGRNFVVEARAGDREQAPEIAEELVRLGVDVIVAIGPMAVRAKAATGAVPLVFIMNGDPAEAKLVASLARPGGTATGISALALELTGKRLELLKDAAPKATRIAVLANAAHPGVNFELAATQDAAQRLGLTLQFVRVRTVADFDAAFEAIARERAEALLAFPDTLIDRQGKAIAEFALRQRIPSISGWPEFAEAGNLMSYGPNVHEFWRHLAAYVDRILKGAKPADLPVEQPTRFELTINRHTAKALGLALPPSLVARADRILE